MYQFRSFDFAVAVQIVGIAVEGVGLIARFDDAVEPVDSHIHQAELGVIFHLLLTVEGHSRVGLHTGFVHKIAGLDKHAAAAAGRVYKDVIFDTSSVAENVYKNSENRRKQGVSCGFRCICRCSICPVRAQPRCT